MEKNNNINHNKESSSECNICPSIYNMIYINNI